MGQKVHMILTRIEELVCSSVLAQYLKVIGIPQVSQYYFWRGQKNDPSDFYAIIRLDHYSTKFVQKSCERWSAYSSGELGAMLPPSAMTRRFLDVPTMWLCEVHGVGGFAAETESDARAKMLLRMWGMPDPNALLYLPSSKTFRREDEA